MVNRQSFDEFMSNLMTTNATLDYFVDFDKCAKNLDKISIYLHTLDYLLGKSDLKSAVDKLFAECKECFEALNILIAVRDDKTNLNNREKKLVELKDYFVSSQKIYEFIQDSGLESIFKDKKISNLHDYVFGIEVGLDSNARKNRGGEVYANMIADFFRGENIKFEREIENKVFKDLDLGVDKKRFDFVIKTPKFVYLIETNFYNTGGSKLNEVSRSYIEISQKISTQKGYKFIWITDGKGWGEAKNKLEEAYKSVEIYNYANLNDFIAGLKQ